MKKIIASIVFGILAFASTANAAALIVPQGGTGWAAISANTLLYGNGTGKIATTTAGTAGYVLSFQSGIPKWVATTTFNSPLVYDSGTVTCVTCGFSTTSTDYWKTQNNFFSTTSANYWSSVGLGFSTTSSNYWETQQSARGVFPFTPTINFNASANSTSTPVWLTSGLQASSTSYISLLRVPAGSVSGVPVGVGNDDNTGIYSGGTDVLGLVAGGTSLLMDLNGVFYPASNNVRDLGKTTAYWRNIYVTYSSSTMTTATNASTTLLSAQRADFGATATSSFSTGGILSLTNLNGPLDARNGVVGATTSVGVFYGGTGLTALGASSTVLTTNGTIAIWQSIVSYVETIIRAASLVLTGNWDFGGAAGLEIPNSSAPTLDALGEIGLDTTANDFLFATSTAYPAVIKPFYTTGFSMSTTTNTFTGTTTVSLAPAAAGLTFVSANCKTNTGTVNVSLYDGTNRANLMNASTTVGTFLFSSNNQFTSTEEILVDVGTAASSPTRLGCRFKFTYDRN